MPEKDRIPIIDSRFTKNFEDGHIPSAITYPFTEVLNADKSFKSQEELIKGF